MSNSAPQSAPVVISLPTGLEISGVTSWAARLSNALVARGRRVALIAHDAPKRRPETPVALDPRVEVVRLVGAPPLDDAAGSYAPFMPAYRDTARRLASESGGPVVALPTLASDSFGLFAALAQTDAESLRVLSWTHNHIEHDFRVASCYEPLIARFVGVSRAITDRIRRDASWRAHDTSCVPYGVEVPGSPPSKRAVAHGALRILYTGRLDQRQKRVTALVSMSRWLDGAGVRHTLTLAGDGPARESVEAAARHAPSVRVLHARPDGRPLTPPDLAPLLAEADLFVMASRFEGLSVALLEALAYACVPVLARTESGQDEVIEPGALGEAADPGDDDDESVGAALAQAVRRVVERGLAAQARLAWERARERFSIEAHARASESQIDLAAASPARWWPGDRPVSAGAATNGGAFSVPSDAVDRIRAALDRLRGRPVALWGAGRHTLAVAPALARTSARIVAVIEDDPARRGGSFLGWPLVSPEGALTLGVTDVVISSWMHEGEMWSKRAPFERAGARVHRLYAQAAPTETTTPGAEFAGRCV